MPYALVTGATGLVGANVVEALNHAGWRVRILRRASSRMDALHDLEYEEAFGDILDEPSLLAAMQGIDVVFHVAGAADYWRKGVEHLYRINVEGTRTVVGAALKAGVDRLVYTSSVSAVGPAPDPDHPVDESHEYTLPPSVFPYAHSKLMAEREVLQGVAQGLDAVIVNPSIVIGPRDVYLTTGTLFQSLRRGLPVVPRGGSGVVDARDVARGHIAAAERGRTGQRYILNAENLSHMALARRIARAMDVRPPVLELPRAVVYPISYLFDLGRALRLPLPADGNTVRLSTYWFFVKNARSLAELGMQYRPIEEGIRDALVWLQVNNRTIGR